MRIPRFRFTIRQIMIAVAVAAPILAVARAWWTRTPPRAVRWEPYTYTVEPPALSRFADPHDPSHPPAGLFEARRTRWVSPPYLGSTKCVFPSCRLGPAMMLDSIRPIHAAPSPAHGRGRRPAIVNRTILVLMICSGVTAAPTAREPSGHTLDDEPLRDDRGVAPGPSPPVRCPRSTRSSAISDRRTG